MTHCHGIAPHGTCPLRGDCYRFTQPTPGRDRFGSLPFDFKSQSCEHFISNIPTDDAIRAAAYYTWLRLGKPEGQSESIWNDARCDAEISLGRKPGA